MVNNIRHYKNVFGVAAIINRHSHENHQNYEMKTTTEKHSNGIVLLTFLVFIQLICTMLAFTLSQTTLQRRMSFNYVETIKEKTFAYSLLRRFSLNLIIGDRKIPMHGKDRNYSFQTQTELLDIDPCQRIKGRPAEYEQITLKLYSPSSAITTQSVIAKPFEKTTPLCQNGKIRRTIRAGIQSLKTLN